jgi:hypothetical protein
MKEQEDDLHEELKEAIAKRIQDAERDIYQETVDALGFDPLAKT